MATVELTADNFNDTIDVEGVVLVDFWAAWCGPCRQFAPIFEKASEAHSEVVFAKLDTDAHNELSTSLEIQAIPTIMGFRDGVLVYRNAGAMNSAGLEQLIGSLTSDELGEQVREAKASAAAETDAAE